VRGCPSSVEAATALVNEFSPKYNSSIARLPQEVRRSAIVAYSFKEKAHDLADRAP
jgi:hypothetical protein